VIRYSRCFIPCGLIGSISLRPEGLFCTNWCPTAGRPRTSTGPLGYVPLAGRRAGEYRDGKARAIAKTATPGTSIGRQVWTISATAVGTNLSQVLVPGERYFAAGLWSGAEGGPTWYTQRMNRPVSYEIGPRGGLTYGPAAHGAEWYDLPRRVGYSHTPPGMFRVGHDGQVYQIDGPRGVVRVTPGTQTSGAWPYYPTASTVFVTDATLLDFALTPDCRRMITAEKTEADDNFGRTFATFHTRVYDLDWPRVTRVHEYTWPATRVAVSPDGLAAAAVEHHRGDVVIFDLD